MIVGIVRNPRTVSGETLQAPQDAQLRVRYTGAVKAHTLELSGDQHFRLVSTIETAIFARTQEINDLLQEEPWADFGWTVESLIADPTQIKKAIPHDDLRP